MKVLMDGFQRNLARRWSVAQWSSAATVFFALLMMWLVPNQPVAMDVKAYAPLHAMLEMFAVAVAAAIFAVGWHAQVTRDGEMLAILAAGFLAVALLDMAHLLSYAGMPDWITPSGPGKAIVFWLAARYAAAFALLAIVAGRKWLALTPRGARIALLLALLYTAAMHWLVLCRGEWLPVFFVDGQGLTALKIALEWILVVIGCITLGLFLARRRQGVVYEVSSLFAALWLGVLSELCFTLYANVADLFNILGHVYKVISYIFLYNALVSEGVKLPYKLLADSQGTLQQLTDHIGQVFWMVALPNREILFVSPAYEAIWGRSCQSLLDDRDSWLDRVHPDDRQRAEDIIPQAVAGVHGIEFRIVRPDGSIRWIRNQTFPISTVSGEFVRVAGIAEDITERMQAESELVQYREHLETLVDERTTALRQSQARLEAIIENLPEAFFMKDSREGRYLLINRRCEEAVGLPREQLVGRTDREIFSEELARAFALSDSEALRSGGTVRIEDRKSRIDGTVHDYLTTLFPLLDEQGKAYALAGIGADITQSNQLKREIIAAKEEAESLARAKSAFMANMSHEIRTPLNAVLGLARIGKRVGPTDQAGELFERILDFGKHLLGVINDILDFSKIEAGKLVIEARPFHLQTVVNEAAGFVAEAAKAKGLALSVSMSPGVADWAAGDSLRLQQILANLLSNAVKFTERGTVSLTVVDGGHSVVFRVSDSGIGMTEAQLLQIFRPFEQADGATTRKYGGSGLGLAISRQLAGMMGGDIAVESRLGEGSVFTLRLPLAPVCPLGHAAAPSPGGGARLEGLRVLAVEDLAINRFILEDLLVQEGADAVFAGSGQEALQRLQQAGSDAFDVVLMDVQMPVMDGREATRRIHALAPDLPVIALTAHALDEERELCLKAGMADHVTKPIDADIFVAAILKATASSPRQHAAPSAEAIVLLQDDGVFESIGGLVDWPALLARFKGRREFVGKLLVTVLESYADMPAKLRHAARNGDMRGLAYLSHGLKGMGGNLEARQLRESAKALEAAVRAGDGKAAALAEELAATVEKLLAELTASNVANGTS